MGKMENNKETNVSLHLGLECILNFIVLQTESNDARILTAGKLATKWYYIYICKNWTTAMQQI